MAAPMSVSPIHSRSDRTGRLFSHLQPLLPDFHATVFDLSTFVGFSSTLLFSLPAASFLHLLQFNLLCLKTFCLTRRPLLSMFYAGAKNVAQAFIAKDVILAAFDVDDKDRGTGHCRRGSRSNILCRPAVWFVSLQIRDSVCVRLWFCAISKTLLYRKDLSCSAFTA